MIRGVHHVSLTVHDMEKMLDFYERTLGFATTASLGWEPGNDMVDGILGLTGSSADIRILRAGNAYLELIKYHSPPDKPVDPAHPVTDCGVRHVAFDVVGIDAEYERLKSAGIRFNSPPTAVTVEGHPVKAAYFRDPEGNVMEIQELLDGGGDALGLPGI